MKSPKNSVVISGIDDVDVQELILLINSSLKSEVIDINNPRLIKEGDNKKLSEFISDLESGSLSGVITSGVNPLYSLPKFRYTKRIFQKFRFFSCVF